MFLIQNVEIAKIQPDPNQPRKAFDRDGIEELKTSLQHNGLLQPIIIRPLNGSGCYRLIAGERRWRAMTELQWETTPAIVRADVDDLTAAKLQLLENITRRDLNPVEEARAYRRFIDEGMEIKEVAQTVGKRPADVQWYIDMLSARDDILQMCATRQISPSVCWHLARLSSNGQMKAIREMTAKNLSASEISMLCQLIFAEEHQMDMFSETKLTDSQIDTARKVKSALDKACQAVQELLKIEEKTPGVIGTVMATEIESTMEKTRLLRTHLGKLQNALQRKQVACLL
ncbi:MAG: ParB/RepB/Spo0J family partition protein [Dehalococcoidia bacterium]|nr:ParB/RepB/Spo0J family partition protein [Dehalococcoidia bacterium]